MRLLEKIDYQDSGASTEMARLRFRTATVSMNGTISRPAGGLGTYSVAADCTGKLVFHPKADGWECAPKLPITNVPLWRDELAINTWRAHFDFHCARTRAPSA